MKKSYLLSLALLTSSIAIAEKDEHREHGSHEHGHASLSVISDTNDLLIALETPAINLFGFEHKPENNEQKKVVNLALKDLKEFQRLISIDSKAECSLVKSDVKQPFDLDDEHEDEHKHEDEHDHQELHDEKNEESTHSDVDIDASFTCKKPLRLKEIDLAPLFKRFPKFVELDAQTIANGQQSAAELSKGKSVLILIK